MSIISNYYKKKFFIFILLMPLTSCEAKLDKERIMTDSTKVYTNKLINEKSPYLLQHAHNPVDWYPWGEEAFELAKKENKPIFLSIGYSTCHWCHVMEHESFEDEEVANLMNKAFISIKVDREERPDVDNIYMSVCQMLTGSGGWPLTIVMTPEQKPFFAGTYFPKFSSGNRIGMMDLIPKLNSAWENQKEDIIKSANDIVNHLKSPVNVDNSRAISEKLFEKAYNSFNNRYDLEYGGFGDKPKFPSPHNLLFLMRYYSTSKNDKALNMVLKTLSEMRKGGIFDQIGFGFHRYSTDKKWFLPHFEKMLYDQAMLTMAYSEAYQLTKNKLFKQTTEEILTYVLRDMTSAEGGFFSAEDADSEGEEGKFYLWTKDEIINLLGKEDGELIIKVFNVHDKGNYFEEAGGHQTGGNILFLDNSMENVAQKVDSSETALYKKVDSLRQILFESREKRIHPYKDDKILTDWNGLMVAALAKSARILNNPHYLAAAEKSVNFIYRKLVDKNGNLLHRYRGGESAIDAQIDDYSFLVWGLLELYETSFDISHLQKSIRLTKHLIDNFWDSENNSGFYFTSEENSELISRPKEFYDGAIPSGNSVMYLNLLKLYKITTDVDYLTLSDSLAQTFNNYAENAPSGFSQFLAGLQFYFGSSYEIVLVGDKTADETKDMLKIINSHYIPNKVVLQIDEINRNKLLKIAPFIEDFIQIDNKATVYICENYTCKLPTNDPEKLKAMLNPE